MFRRGALLAAALAAGCSGDAWPDMSVQPTSRSRIPPRPEPERSIPLGAEIRYAGRDDTASLSNPVPAIAASLAHGRAIFVDRCAPCHGLDGHGGGPVGRLFPRPADLAYEKVRARSDGFVWGTITYGGEAMPSAREGLGVRDRWDVVNWVRALQAGALP